VVKIKTSPNSNVSVTFVDLRGVGALRGLVGDDEHWRKSAACRTADYRLFDPVSSRETAGVHGQPDRVLSAVQVCSGCPVTKECYAVALQTRAFGVWGGVLRRQNNDSVSIVREIVIDPDTGRVALRRTVRHPRTSTENPQDIRSPLT
jgi:hypothetical protein